MHVLGGWVHRHPDAWIRLGNLETRVLQEAIADIKVEQPVYVAGWPARAQQFCSSGWPSIRKWLRIVTLISRRY